MRPDPIFPDDYQDDQINQLKNLPGSRSSGLSRFWLIAIIIAVLVIGWPVWAGFHTDWLWFRQLGYQSVFTTTLLTKLLLGVIVGLITAAIVWVNFKLAQRLSPGGESPSRPVRFVEINGERIATPDFSRVADRFALPASLVAGVFAGLTAWGAWEIFLQFRHQTSFGETDPIFGRDIAFYFFTLPMMEAVSRWLFLAVVVSLIGSALIYVVRGAIEFGQSRASFNLARGPRAHLLCLIAAAFLIFAWQAYVAMPNLLFGGDGPVAGARYADVNALLPILYVQGVVALVVALLAIASIFLASNRLLWIGAFVYLLTIAAGWVYPGLVQRFSVAPNELAKETPYIQYNIAATRKAFGLDKIEERELTGEKTLTAGDVQKNQLTINNIRLWDQGPLLETFAQIQEIRTYYEFNSVDNDRYSINGELQQVMLSARELPSASLPTRNWINERLTFTHGFGLTLGPVDEVTAQGQPVLFVRDIPPVSTVPSLKIDRPEIYFGEMTDEHVYVKTSAKEFSYPAGAENVFKNYEGEGGVPIGSYFRRLLFSTRFGDLKLMLSNDLRPESHVLFNRNIKERLEQVAPYLLFDSDPYLVVNEGRLFWIADAYTTSDRYPYSQALRAFGRGINYIRNSVKAVVDAYHGHTSLYIADERDPLVQTYGRIFPGTLKPLSEMPEGLRAHLRYPEDIFKMQAQVYSTYHMDQPQVFYNKEDLWTVAVMGNASNAGAGNADAGRAPVAQTQVIEPYYTIMKLPGEKTEEFILMQPFTPKNKDNLASWMAARADGENYGKLVVYRFPKQKLIYGPKQIVARANQEPEISRQLTLWNQRGSGVNLGTLMVIPIEESLIYVLPLYLRAETGRIPELRRVIVAADERIAMEPTLAESLARLFGQPLPGETKPDAPAPGPGETLATTTSTANVSGAGALSAQAKQHYDRAIQAQREGDWARYGEEIKRLGAVIEQMSRRQ
ncbi:MAG: UPF0182 family protein [Blastocatellia bacterium]